MKSLIVAWAIVATSVVSFRAATPVSLGVRGRANANASMAADGRFVAVVWSASTAQGVTDIYAAVSRDAGATFSAPVRVNLTPGTARVNGEQPPRVSLVPRAGAEPSIVVVWTAKGAAGTALITARSLDGGRRFGRDGVVPGTDAAGNRGWEAIATDKNGRVDAIWLDHRETVSGSAGDMANHADHQMSASMQMDSVAKAQLSKLYFGTLGGPATARPLTGGVCYCCKTALAAGADGALYAAWRHVYPGNLRDIAFTVSRDGGQTFAAPIRVSEDKWALDGCPENGPSLAVDSRNQVHIVWPTLVRGPSGGPDTLGLFYSVSRDGRQFAPRQSIPTEGTPRHVQIAVAGDGSPTLVWDESEGDGRRVVVARGSIDHNGHMQFRRQMLTALGNASYPALVLTPNGALVAAATGAPADSVIRFIQVHVEE